MIALPSVPIAAEGAGGGGLKSFSDIGESVTAISGSWSSEIRASVGRPLYPDEEDEDLGLEGDEEGDLVRRAEVVGRFRNSEAPSESKEPADPMSEGATRPAISDDLTTGSFSFEALLLRRLVEELPRLLEADGETLR